MSTIKLVALMIYVVAAALQIGSLALAWVKTVRESDQARRSLEDQLAVDEEFIRREKALHDDWERRCLPYGHEFCMGEEKELLEWYENAMDKAGHRKVTWFYRDTIADQVWAHVLKGARETYKREGLALIIGIFLATVASVLTLLPVD